MFFDLISASAPHIYTSALLLSPHTSMVHEMYHQYKHPLARIVHGLSTSWEPVVATAYHKDPYTVAAWSPCNKFIAVFRSKVVEIRDAVTLTILGTFESSDSPSCLGFSPDSRFLAQFDHQGLITWDLQTGSSVGIVLPGRLLADDQNFSPVYSIDGGMLAVVCGNKSVRHYNNTFIATHNLSTTDEYRHKVPSGHLVYPLWTHDEFLRFAMVELEQITIWEVKFSSTNAPQVVEYLSAPEEITGPGVPREFLFVPKLSRLASSDRNVLCIWDAQGSKLLLKTSPFCARKMTFSSDGHFFACMDLQGEKGVCVWKESPAGYVLHQQFASATFGTEMVLHLSPNGEFVLMSHHSTIRLLHTKDSILPSSPTPIEHLSRFILRFSTNKKSAAFGYYKGKIVKILDLQSGDLQFTVDTCIEVECLGVTENTLVVVSKEKILTWNLTVGNTRADINNSVQAIKLNLSLPSHHRFGFFHMSISHDLSHIVASIPERGYALELPANVQVCNTSTGRRLVDTTIPNVGLQTKKSWFTLDGSEIWGVSYENSPVNRWKIMKDSNSGIIGMQPLALKTTVCPPGVLPWQSTLGFEVTDDGWILSHTQKRLLWLPHFWRSAKEHRTWDGHFLGLEHPELSEIVILKFFE